MGSRGTSSASGHIKGGLFDDNADLGERNPNGMMSPAQYTAHKMLGEQALAEHEDQHWSTLSSSEKAAAFEYTGAGYKDLNLRLREGRKLTPKQEQLVAELDKAVTRSLPKNMILHRGMELTDHELLQITSGSTIVSKGFASTSGQHIPVGNVTMNIRAKAGSKSLVIGRNSKKKYEQEVLLPRGSVFKVTKVLSRTWNPGFPGANDQVHHTLEVELQ